jgi:hypothetical protein
MARANAGAPVTHDQLRDHRMVKKGAKFPRYRRAVTIIRQNG